MNASAAVAGNATAKARMQLVLVTGLSGSGKSIAINVLADDGYFCIDNLPPQFLQPVIDSLQQQGHRRVAVSVDSRAGQPLQNVRDVIGQLQRLGHDVRVLFLNARSDSLVQRYSETRRRHPLTMAAAGVGEPVPTLMESIERERELLSVLQDLGPSLDTSDLPPNVLRQWVRELVGTDRAAVTLLFESFAFKYGVPLDADLVFDVRCLPNPYYTSKLRPLTGLQADVVGYLEAIPAVQKMIDHIAEFLQTWLPSYVQENRSYLTVALGCTGGQHRSVYCVERLAERFRATEQVLVRHRALAVREGGHASPPQHAG
ncbi:MAG TPA: RNase adapter RapZ [Burkholderiaceae bacterium]|jgi:RNase adapter protein RapZ|nr:RNase adapter RapZ [Burkholderiaceae bacterium]